MNGLMFDDDENLRVSAEINARVLMGLKEKTEQAYHAGILTTQEFEKMYGELYVAWVRTKDELKRLGARPLLDEKE